MASEATRRVEVAGFGPGVAYVRGLAVTGMGGGGMVLKGSPQKIGLRTEPAMEGSHHVCCHLLTN